MMNEKDRTDQINERMMEDQVHINAHIKDLRGLGGTRTRASYTDVVMSAYDCVNDLTDDNGCDYQTNLSLFLEGLEEDILELRNGQEQRHIPVRPKGQSDVDEN
jgi:hypothetical protein